jgi:cobalt-precorrin 5A hydrolase/precorrin-3B C17-methyltransferase
VSGRLFGVGVGPGDPELLTLKAVRLLAEADVVFCPAGSTRARTTAAAHLEGKRVIPLEMEMRGDREAALRAAAETVVRELAGGTGAYLTEGDPSLYSTFGLLAAALARSAPDLEVRAVAGVSAITAAAAAAGLTLGMGDQSLAVLPASAPGGVLDDVLETFDTTVLLKPSMAEDLGERLRRLGLAEGSALVEDATRASERVLRGEDAGQARPPYFSTWLVPGGAAGRDRGRVHFVGAGPGAARHLTRRALALLRRADLMVAADSLVAPEVIGLARGRVIASAELTLEELVPPMIEAAGRGQVVVRLHSGDPSVYGALSEQLAWLRAAGCPYEVVPGVSSAFAAAAALGVELTEPGGSQTVVLTRHGRRVPVPERERLRELAGHRSTIAVFLSAAAAGEVERELLEAGLDPETPAAVAHRVSWPDEVLERTTVAAIGSTVRRLGLRRHTLILAGDALAPGRSRSRLYDSGHVHVHRRRGPASVPAMPRPPALVAVTPQGERLARRLARSLAGATVLGDASRLPDLFAEGTPLVAFMAVGAAVRLLAPALRDKRAEPPVVAVDDAGRFAVSLVGGRSAGANRLAAYVASVLGAEAVVTTAAERLGLPALDDALAAFGWRLEEGSSLTHLEAAVVRGEAMGFHGPGLEPPPGFGFVEVPDLTGAGGHARGLAVTDRLLDGLPPGWALARPRRLVLGFGCATAATPEEAVEVAREALRGAGLAPAGVREVATIDRRREHPAARRLADGLGARLVACTAAELDAVAVPNRSEAVREAVGTGSVAEAAALRRSGGRLLVSKHAGRQVTVAVAEATA